MISKSITPNEKMSVLRDTLPLDTYSGAKYLTETPTQIMMDKAGFRHETTKN